MSPVLLAASMLKGAGLNKRQFRLVVAVLAERSWRLAWMYHQIEIEIEEFRKLKSDRIEV